MNAPWMPEIPVRLTSLAHGGGCGCKLAPRVLEQILAKTAKSFVPKELLVGIETSDDAAVYRINETQAIVATTDFFMPIVDDPFDFGAIAATNAISDVYAMGGTPLFALAIVGMPIDKLPVESIRRILEGGESVCRRAGIPIAGGHSIDSVEPIYGLVAIGLVNPEHLKRNADARPGDKIVLGKGLGVGIYSAALKKEKLRDEHYRAMLASTTKLNTPGSEAVGTARGARAHRRDRLRLARSPAGSVQGLEGPRHAALGRDPAAPGSDGTGARGLRDRCLQAQLGELRRARGPERLR